MQGSGNLYSKTLARLEEALKAPLLSAEKSMLVVYLTGTKGVLQIRRFLLSRYPGTQQPPLEIALRAWKAWYIGEQQEQKRLQKPLITPCQVILPSISK
jgi:hypothetical protein